MLFQHPERYPARSNTLNIIRNAIQVLFLSNLWLLLNIIQQTPIPLKPSHPVR